MFILYASFLDFFWNGFGVLFWIGWGFALSAFFFFAQCSLWAVGHFLFGFFSFVTGSVWSLLYLGFFL